ncbi:LysR family transcriptional regulator [Variovorax sp. KK3]|uniref:LysR family transcriptional regulator n=1 Tax=Variovorax sp. KK3 TaxID=1855728 RepID=UPI00097BD83A|nr:LysR family transcriptional regulator [Variovorax sp. KK3]
MPVFPNNVSLRQLRAFSEVAAAGSFAAAARKLFITQSALSESIKQLEGALGVRLLDRTTRTVGLTQAGQIFLEDVKLALGSLEQGRRRMADLQSLNAGEVCIAAAPSVLANIVMPCLPALAGKFPALRVTLREEGGAQVVRCVREGEADIGVGGWHPDAANVSTQPLLDDSMGLVALPDEPLLRKKKLAIADLSSAKIVGLTSDTAIAQLILRSEDVPPNVLAPALRVSNPALMQQAIRLGLGVAVVPALIAHHPEYAKLGFRVFTTPRIARRICIFQSSRRSLSIAAALVLDAVVRRAAVVARFSGIELADG